MALLRSFVWAVVLISASFAGPNVPAQFMAALRDAGGAFLRRLFAFRW